MSGDGTLFDADDWAELGRRGVARAFRKGQVLLREGETDGRVLAIMSGRAKISVLAPSGRELVLGVKGSGELVGEYAALDGRPRSATVTALENVEVRVLRSSEFHEFLDDCPRAALVLLRELAAQLRRAGRETVDRDHGDVAVRVARRLVDLAERYGEYNGATVAIGLSLTQDDLAAWVGATREATNRALSAMKAAGCLHTGRQRIVITDLPALRAHAA